MGYGPGRRAYAVTHHPRGHAGFVVGTAAYVVGSAICHQRPERSFHVWGAQLPVCARCAGLYAGALLGVLAAWFPIPPGGRRGGSDTRRLRMLLVIASAPTVAAVAGEVVGIIDPGNLGRALAALPLGAAVSWFAGLFLGGAID